MGGSRARARRREGANDQPTLMRPISRAALNRRQYELTRRIAQEIPGYAMVQSQLRRPAMKVSLSRLWMRSLEDCV